MQFLLDQLAYGNPSQEDMRNIEVTSYLDDLVRILKSDKHAPFLNTSPATREELRQLVTYSELQEHSARRNIFDGDLVPYVRELFVRNGCESEPVHRLTLQIVQDVLPVITKLKYHYQRPRPYQLAYYFGMKFYPNFSRYVSSPSYPSGHSVLGAVLTEVLAAEYSGVFTTCYEVMRKLCGEIMESRLYMGVHYPSDNRFALHVAQQLLNHPGFREKYNL